MASTPLDLTEEITRYIFEKSKIVISVPRARHTAFLPRDGRLSVFRIKDLVSDSIWELGKEIGALRGKPLLARADMISQIVIDAQLNIEVDDNPPRHASIVSWPEDESAIKQRALELAEKAKLHIK